MANVGLRCLLDLESTKQKYIYLTFVVFLMYCKQTFLVMILILVHVLFIAGMPDSSPQQWARYGVTENLKGILMTEITRVVGMSGACHLNDAPPPHFFAPVFLACRVGLVTRATGLGLLLLATRYKRKVKTVSTHGMNGFICLL